MAVTSPRLSALDGLQVLDCSRGMAGPLSAMLLADFGADVVKVVGPDDEPDRLQPGWPVWNRGKRAVRLDRRGARLRSLVDQADVCVVSERLPDLRGGPLDPEPALSRNPRLVFLHTPPFTAEGDWAGGTESHGLLHAASGLALNQASSGEGPVDVIAPFIHVVQGVWAAASAGAALWERRQSGRGQIVTVSGMHAALVAGCSYYTFDSDVPPCRRPPIGGAGGGMPYYRLYECSDGQWLFLAALSEDFTRRAFEVLGVTDILTDGRLGDRGRYALLEEANAEWAIERLSTIFATRPAAEWLRRLDAVGCPASAVSSREEWFDHPQVAAIGMRIEVPDPDRSVVAMPGIPVDLSATPGQVRAGAPSGRGPDALPEWRAHPETAPGSERGPIGTGPLRGIRVADLGTVLAGPFAGSLLADLGAEVVKVEPPGGESFRGAGFAPYNKGQRGLVLDLRHGEGRQAFLDLARTLDVVIDNYRPGVATRLGIDHAELSRINPEITTVSISGFGEAGPLGGLPGYDPVLQALSGSMEAQGGGTGPVITSVPSNDVISGCVGAFGAIIALLARDRVGSGQRVTTSLAAAATLTQAADLVRFAGRPAPRRGGRDFSGPSPLECFHRTSDGWIRVEAVRQTIGDLLKALGASVPEDSGGAEVAAVVRRLAELSTGEAVEALSIAGIPVVATPWLRQVAASPALVEAGFFRPYPEEGLQHWTTTGIHAGFSRTAAEPTAAAPRLGADTVSVLAAASLDPGRIAELLAVGVAFQASPDSGRPATME